jgi:poly(U)-specific endoribonuclease
LPECKTGQEEREEIAFLNAIMNTRVMKEAHRFLVDEHKVSANEKEFKNFLQHLWFDFYSRSQREK